LNYGGPERRPVSFFLGYDSIYAWWKQRTRTKSSRRSGK